MTDFRPMFERLGLQQYNQTFADEGFETWEIILEITESDLDALRVKLGHRRVLQREIALVRAANNDRWAPVNSPSRSHTSRESTSLAREDSSEAADGELIGSVPRKKRRYRRHPKPDDNAPERPPSAYVVFSNKIREDLKGHNLSFTEIAKLVGERWQHLSIEEKEPFETQASLSKEKYHRQMTTYKTTDLYRDYQQYLIDFKQRYGSSSENVRPRLEHGQSTTSTDPGSGAEGSLSGTSKMEPSHSALNEANQPTISAPSRDSHHYCAASISRPSSVSTSSPLQDSGPQYGQRSSRSSDTPWTKRMDQPSELSQPRSSFASNVQHTGPQPQSFAYIPPTASSPSLGPHETQLTHSRRRPLGANDHIPSFRHQDSSISSVMSSQSSTSTAATSNSTYRNAEDEAHPYVTLPPISAVTGMTREGQSQDVFASRSESVLPGSGAALNFIGRRPVTPFSSEPVTPAADRKQPTTAFGDSDGPIGAHVLR